MRIALYNDLDVEFVSVNAQAAHLARPLSVKGIERLLEKADRLIQVTLTPFCMDRLSKKALKLLEAKGIELKATDARGRPIKMSFEDMVRAYDLKRAGYSYREIEKNLRIPKSTIHYLLSYAKRGKIKKEDRVLHVD